MAADCGLEEEAKPSLIAAMVEQKAGRLSCRLFISSFKFPI
jgi:hypothetical protein